MHQAVNAGLQLHESAEGSDADDLAGHDRAFGILRGGGVPGLGLQLLQAQLNALALLVQAEDLDFHFLIGGDDLRGMLHVSPAQVGHMDQAVHAAQIHESAEVGQTANDALDHFALSQLAPSFGLAGFVFFLDHRAAAADDPLLLLVQLDDLQLQGLTDELADLFHVAVGELRRRHERADAVHGADQAALDDFLAHTLDVFAVVVLFDKLGKGLFVQDVALRKQYIAFAVVDLDDLHFDFIVQLHILGNQVFALDQSVRLEANVDANFIVRDLDNLAHNGLAGSDPNQSRFHVSHKAVLFGLLRVDLVQLFLVSHACDNLLKCPIRRAGAGGDSNGFRMDICKARRDIRRALYQ